MIALWRAADREQLGELGDRVVSVPNELEDVDALAGAELGLLAFELAVGAGDRHPFAGAQVRWTRSRALELGGQFPALRGRGPCLLLCSCSMPPDGDARPRRCRSFTPAGRPGTRVSATRPTRRRSRRSSRLCAKAGHARYGNRLNGLIVVLWRAGLRINEALSLTETDLEEQRGSNSGQAWQERSPPPGRDGRLGVVSARTGGSRSARRCRRPVVLRDSRTDARTLVVGRRGQAAAAPDHA